jgi:DNA-binding response OmpR family regulator
VDLLASFLGANGFEVATAPDGNRAVELGISGDYGLAILDVHMPLYSGMEVLAMLRGRHRLHPMKVIALTGDATSGVREAMEDGGVDDFMVKPVDLKALLEKVRRLAGET